MKKEVIRGNGPSFTRLISINSITIAIIIALWSLLCNISKLGTSSKVLLSSFEKISSMAIFIVICIFILYLFFGPLILLIIRIYFHGRIKEKDKSIKDIEKYAKKITFIAGLETIFHAIVLLSAVLLLIFSTIILEDYSLSFSIYVLALFILFYVFIIYFPKSKAIDISLTVFFVPTFLLAILIIPNVVFYFTTEYNFVLDKEMYEVNDIVKLQLYQNSIIPPKMINVTYSNTKMLLIDRKNDYFRASPTYLKLNVSKCVKPYNSYVTINYEFGTKLWFCNPVASKSYFISLNCNESIIYPENVTLTQNKITNSSMEEKEK